MQYVLMDAETNVICPATKLWNTGHGANMLREAVSLMGGYGITEDCPGFLGNKWMDAQLEATYEGPEAVQRRQMTVTMTSEVFLAQFRSWTAEMRRIASTRPGTGACTLASAMQMWLWTLNHLQKATDPTGGKLYHGQRQGVTFALADALCWLLASRAQILDVLELEAHGPDDPVAAEGLEGTVQFLSDLCHTQAAQAAGEVSRICAELVFGYNCHPSWDEEEHRSCFLASELEELEETMPGISAMALDVLAADGTHPQKAGPCAGCAGNDDFLRMQSKLTACLTGSRLAKDRAAETVSKVMIPEALDYPARAAFSVRYQLVLNKLGAPVRIFGPGNHSLDVPASPRYLFFAARVGDAPGHESATVSGDRMSVETTPPNSRDRPPVDGSGHRLRRLWPGHGRLSLHAHQAWNENPADPAFESRVTPGMPLQVLCYERADDISSGVSGVVTRGQAIRASFPALNPAEIPMAVPVTSERVMYLLDPIGASRRSLTLRAG